MFLRPYLNLFESRKVLRSVAASWTFFLLVRGGNSRSVLFFRPLVLPSVSMDLSLFTGLGAFSALSLSTQKNTQPTPPPNPHPKTGVAVDFSIARFDVPHSLRPRGPVL